MKKAGFWTSIPCGMHLYTKDGREATAVYHNLDGYGIVWGFQEVDIRDLPEPEAMLRDPYPGATLPCVGEEYRPASHSEGSDTP